MKYFSSLWWMINDYILPYLFHSVFKVFWPSLNCFVILLEVNQMIYWNCYHSSVFTIGVLSTPKIVFFLFRLLLTLFQRKRKGKSMNFRHERSNFGIYLIFRMTKICAQIVFFFISRLFTIFYSFSYFTIFVRK